MKYSLKGGYSGWKKAVIESHNCRQHNPAVRYSHKRGFFSESSLTPKDDDILYSSQAHADDRLDAETYRFIRQRIVNRLEGNKMKRIIVGFTEETKTRVLQELKLHMKHTIVDNNAAILEVFDQVGDRVEGSHEPTYEIASTETTSGEPVLIGFIANDFIYEIA